MVFSGFTFLAIFLPALLALYFVVPARFRSARNLVLLAFSLFFYGYGGPEFLLLMLASIVINYAFGLLSFRKGRGVKGAVALSVIMNLALLGYFKYAGFLCTNLAALGADITVPNIVLPIGISFFTFQGMSYVIDVYRGEVKAAGNPLKVALYISLFPQLIAGPIVRYSTIAEEIGDRRENLDDFSDGLTRFIIGLGKKVIIANSVGQMADGIFALPAENMTVSLAWLGAVAYALQIYFDFSGYSDMAIGLGRMFGFHFLENFDYPYVSKSITEFWRRWHISLSTWFRDYLYIPLGGNRRGKKRQIFNMLIVWGLTGLWHGAAWNFLLWGLYYFLLLVGEKYVWKKQLAALPNFFKHVYSLLFILFGWVIFRAENISTVLSCFSAMFGGAVFSDGLTGYYLAEYGWVLLIAALASLPVKKKLEAALEKRRGKPFIYGLSQWGPKIWALGLFVLCYVRLLSGTFNPFIYFRF